MGTENRQPTPIDTPARPETWAARAIGEMPVPAAFCQGEIITWVNKAFCAALRVRPEDVVGRNLPSLVDEADAPRVRQLWEALRRGEQAPESYEITLLRGDGTRFHGGIEPRSVGAGEMLVVVRDLGDPLYDSALLGALGEIAVRVQRARSLSEVLHETAEGLHAIGFQVLSLRPGDPQRPFVGVRIAEALRAWIEALAGGRVEDLRLPAGRAALPEGLLEDGRPLYVGDVEPLVAAFLVRNGLDAPADLGRVLRETGVTRLVLAPLVVDHVPWGVLVLAAPRLRSHDTAALSLFAAQVASALEVAQSLENLERQKEDLALLNEVGGVIAQHLELDEVLSTAMQHLSRIVEVPNTFLMLMEPGGDRMHALATNLPGPEKLELSISVHEPSAATEAVRTRKAVVIEDTATDPRVSRYLVERFGHRAMLAVPLLSEGRPVGAMVLGETRGPRRFSRWEIDRALALANQLASAIDKARLYDEQRLRVRHLRLLLENSQVITGSLELEQILAASAQGLVRMVDATDAFIWFLEDTDLRGVVCSSKEFQEHFSQLRVSLSEGSAVGLAIQNRSPVRIEDAERSPEIEGSIDSMYGQKSVLALPLMLREVPIGAISIGDRRRTRRFTDDEVERTLLMSRQVAVAIDNARLFQDLKRSYTELSRAQQELVKRERLAALGELSAVVAHEVRNPLGVIFNSLASLRRHGPQDEDARMLLSIVGEEAERLNRMVSDLLDFARPHVPQLQPESLGEILRGAAEAAARAMPGAPVKIAVDVMQELPPVPVDAEMIRQAMVNLVMNAMQAMPRGGEVTVRAREEARGSARYARVEVQDNGPGIPPDQADLVFQPFFTTRAAGTGLGLAVVKRIADAHRAELAVRSTPGGGSTFILWLPA